MKKGNHTGRRDRLLASARTELARWQGQFDRLREVLPRAADRPAAAILPARLEELRHKHRTVETKLVALEKAPDHEPARWRRAARELQEADSELRETWRSVLGQLERGRLQLN